MGRPALDPAYKARRLAQARRTAAKLNKKTPPQVYACASAQGRVYLRYEPPGGRKVVLRSPYPSIEFDTELLALRKGINPALLAPTKERRAPASSNQNGTWRWLCDAYFRSASFQKYMARDQRVRKGVLLRTCDAPLLPSEPDGHVFGDMPLEKFRTKAVMTLRDRFAAFALVPDQMFTDQRNKDRQWPTKPEAGNSVVRYVRIVLDWALTEHADMIGNNNWAKGVKYFPQGDGHKTWGERERSAFEETYAQGTRERLIYDLALLTGQRLSDIARLSPAMINEDGNGRRLQFRQAKGRMKNPVTAFVPMYDELEAALLAAKKTKILGANTYIAKPNGDRYTSESLANLFRDACKKAGLKGYSMHGLRKTAVNDLIKLRCTTHEIMAITGHRSPKEVERYGREYDREIAAANVGRRWKNRPDPITPDVAT